MIIILGLVVLVAAVVIGVAGVLVNHGSDHALVHPFAVFGYHVTGSTGTLFLYGIVVGAIGVAGLSLLLAGARRTARRGSDARRGLRQSRQETAAVSRDREAARRPPAGGRPRAPAPAPPPPPAAPPPASTRQPLRAAPRPPPGPIPGPIPAQTRAAGLGCPGVGAL